MGVGTYQDLDEEKVRRKANVLREKYFKNPKRKVTYTKEEMKAYLEWQDRADAKAIAKDKDSPLFYKKKIVIDPERDKPEKKMTREEYQRRYMQKPKRVRGATTRKRQGPKGEHRKRGAVRTLADSYNFKGLKFSKFSQTFDLKEDASKKAKEMRQKGDRARITYLEVTGKRTYYIYSRKGKEN